MDLRRKFYRDNEPLATVWGKNERIELFFGTIFASCTHIVIISAPFNSNIPFTNDKKSRPQTCTVTCYCYIHNRQNWPSEIITITITRNTHATESTINVTRNAATAERYNAAPFSLSQNQRCKIKYSRTRPHRPMRRKLRQWLTTEAQLHYTTRSKLTIWARSMLASY